jgi:hypothetical protein
MRFAVLKVNSQLNAKKHSLGTPSAASVSQLPNRDVLLRSITSALVRALSPVQRL